jgi:hypothetical protein
VRFAAARNLQVRRPLAERLIQAARDALPTPQAQVARRVLAADLALLADLDAQVAAAEAELARLLPASPFAVLTSVPGWGVVRAASYGAALETQPAGPPPSRFTGPPGCPRRSTNRPANAATAASAARAASNSAAR